MLRENTLQVAKGCGMHWLFGAQLLRSDSTLYILMAHHCDVEGYVVIQPPSHRASSPDCKSATAHAPLQIGMSSHSERQRHRCRAVQKSTTAWPCPASARCLRWRPLVAAPPPFGLRRVLEGDCCAGGLSAARRRLRLILLCSRRYLEGQRIIRRA